MKTKLFSLAAIFIFFLSFQTYSQGRNRIQDNWGRNFRGEQFFNQRNRMPNIRQWDFQRFSNRDTTIRENLFTDEQQEQLTNLQSNRDEELKPLNDELRELKAHHITLTTADEPDLDAIYESIDKINEIEASIEKIQVKYQQDVRSILTEEQLQRFGNRERMMSRRLFR